MCYCIGENTRKENFTMKKDRSTITSFVCVIIFSVVLLAIAFTAPRLTRVFMEFFNRPETVFIPIVATFYCVFPFAAAVLLCLGVLLANIINGKVFISQNVKLLRAISVFLFIATIIFFVSSFHMPSFWLLTVCAAFMVLIVRVVKNCFAAAVILKDESELTI